MSRRDLKHRILKMISLLELLNSIQITQTCAFLGDQRADSDCEMLELARSRTNTFVVCVRFLCPILDVEFTIDGKQFASLSDVSGGNASENSIIVWDISRQVPLSNQVFAKAYSSLVLDTGHLILCGLIKWKLITIFSSSPPFKLDKFKSYESHGVSGFLIKCNFSLDREKLVSGSSDSYIYLYF